MGRQTDRQQQTTLKARQPAPGQMAGMVPGHQQKPAGSAMSSTSTFHPHKLSIILLRYYMNGGPAGRGECNE